MITFKPSWILGLVAMVACGGRSPLEDGGGSLPLVASDGGLPSCAGGLTQCGRSNVSLCYDLGRSKDHCGACGHVCPPGIACRAGTCQQVRCQGPLTFKTIEVVTSKSLDPARPYRPALGDFDGDGRLDIAGAPEIGDVGGVLAGAQMLSGTNLLYGAGDGTFPTVRPLETSRVESWQYVSSDLDGDGVLDLVSIHKGDAAVSVRRGSKDRNAPFAPAVAYPTSQAPDSLLVSDLDADGRLDLVAGVASGLEHWRGQGDGRFEHQARLSSRGTSPSLGAVDWNRDGAMDLVYGSPNLRLRYGRGDGTFDPEVVCGIGLADSPLPAFPALADLDHDGSIDMVGARSFFFGFDGCTPGKITVVPRGRALDSRGLEIADLDGDGNLDVLTGWGGVYLGDGKGGLVESPTELPGAKAFLVGDLNRDGKLDVIATRDADPSDRSNPVIEYLLVLLNTCP